MQRRNIRLLYRSNDAEARIMSTAYKVDAVDRIVAIPVMMKALRRGEVFKNSAPEFVKGICFCRATAPKKP